MIAGKSMRADRVKRSQDVQFSAGHRGGITKCEDFSLHDEKFQRLRERGKASATPITGMDAKKQL